MTSRAADFGCNTYSYLYAQRADACVERLMSRGFREFELMAHPGHLWPPSPKADGLPKLRRALDRGNARIVTLNMPNIDINIAAANEDMRDYSLGILEGLVRLAGELGASGVVIGPGKANPLFPADEAALLPHFFAALDRLAPIAKVSGTELWAENMPFALLPGIDEIIDALDRHGDPSIGIVYDVANAHFISEDIHAGLKRARSRLKLVHLSDTTQQIYRHDPIGKGDVPFAAIPAMLRDVGYRSNTMLEIISRDPDADLIDSVTRLAAMGF
jgi:L-ribulose-5-phosphate 3-epimerase